MSTSMVVRRKDLHHIEWVEHAQGELGAGRLRLRIDAFALTANNITYAAFGEAMDYWQFFPTGDPETGCIPVWGFADVIETGCADIRLGERIYGYWPIADEAVVEPVRINDFGFVDGAAHRSDLHAVYNQYLRCSADPAYVAEQEAEQALLRPLFTTSFLIDDFLASHQFFGASTVVLSSASSKTAYGTAFCLARRRGSAEAVKIIGLTSPANLEFARSLSCYDELVVYADVAAGLGEQTTTVYVDFSGSASLRATVHGRLGDQLAYSCSVGGTHWQDIGSGTGLPGPRPVLFFAPAQVKQRIADWGASGLQAKIAEAWKAFLQPVAHGDRPWLEVVRGQGSKAIETCYLALLGGRSNPRQGHFLSP